MVQDITFLIVRAPDVWKNDLRWCRLAGTTRHPMCRWWDFCIRTMGGQTIPVTGSPARAGRATALPPSNKPQISAGFSLYSRRNYTAPLLSASSFVESTLAGKHMPDEVGTGSSVRWRR